MIQLEKRLQSVCNREIIFLYLFNSVEFTDPDVCQFYLCGFCPNELFVNTKADLGPCKKIHDENLRREYQVQA